MSPLLALLTTVIEVAIELGQSDTDADYLDDAGRIIGSPAAGPKPEHNGERGGYAQLFTALGIFAAVGFIAWRIRREMAAGSARQAS